MTKSKPKTKAKQQKAVSRAVKQAGFKNIKEAKEELKAFKANNPSNKKECCMQDETTQELASLCCATASLNIPRENSIGDITFFKEWDALNNSYVLTIKIRY
jgi:phage replication-related protein YjqB (UPF0714/DUF867 family)